jgi:hypothetical protein
MAVVLALVAPSSSASLVLLGFVETWQRRCDSGEEGKKSVRERNGDLEDEEEKRREFGEEMKNEGEEGRERGLRSGG